jgi:catechol 2,3-dioxygenase
MALKGVLRPGYIQIRVLDMDAAITHYADRLGLHEVSREADGRVYLRAWDEFDRHSVVLRQADMPGMDYVGFKVASPADVDVFHRRIAEYGIEVEEIPRRRTAGARPPFELCGPERPSHRAVCRNGPVGERPDDAKPGNMA